MTPGVRLLVSTALLVAALVGLQFRGTGEAIPVRQSLDRFPETLGSWQGREGSVLEAEVLNVLRVKDYLVRRYVDPSGRSLWLYIGYWDSQRKGAQIHSPQNCLPGSGWEPLEASRLTIPLGSASGSVTVNRYLIQKDRDQQVVLYWYQEQGQAIAGEIAAKAEMIRSAFLRNRTDGALVRVSSPVYGSVADTTASLVAYVQAMYPVLGEFLPG